jgi:hypothetical protein
VYRKLTVILLFIGLAALILLLFFLWCPPDVCRALNIQTYTISSLDEYREFLADESAFKTHHSVRAVRVDCSALRDDVVAALEKGRLILGVSESNGAPGNSLQAGQVKAWHQGRLLHVGNGTFENREESEAWAVKIREMLSERQERELAFLPRLFGGLIIHVHNKEAPVVLFSRNPCI